MSTSPRPRTFPDLLAGSLRSAPARPLVTFYDDLTGERVELSATTYANWVAKTAGLVQDELDVEPGGLVLLDLPVHWLGAVWLGGAWSAGLAVTFDVERVEEADLVVCGPDGLETYGPRAADVPVVALSLRPLGARFAQAPPPGVVDYGAVVLAQPDAFVPLYPPGPESEAWRTGSRSLSQQDLVTEAAASALLQPGGRLLTDVNPCSARGVATLLAPLLSSGGVVWVAHPDESRWQQRYDQERATAALRAAGSS